jgi:hypothetical protein
MPDGRSLTTDEFLATLNHSILPTIVVEGDEDVIIFRRLESAFPNLTLSVLPVGGRSQVFAIYNRRGEIRGSQKLVFVADLDLWVFSNVPPEYVSDNLLFTDGYSIENDVFRDCCCEALLKGEERARFAQDVEVFSEWFALAVSRGLEVAVHPNHLLDNEVQRNAMMALAAGEPYPQTTLDKIKTDHFKFLRGKSLFQLFQRQMRGARVPKHSSTSLLEHAAARPGAHLSSLFDKAAAALEPTTAN